MALTSFACDTDSVITKATILSFQLPDLLALTRSFPFRVNNHCKYATDASEKFFLLDSSSDSVQTCSQAPGNDKTVAQTSSALPTILSPTERNNLRSMKFGLLAALCFPTCDASQLHVLTDLLTALFTSSARLISTGKQEGRHGQGTSWQLCPHNPQVELSANNSISILERHPMLHRIISPRLTRLVSLLPSKTAKHRWMTQFTSSVDTFIQTNLTLQYNITNNIVPSLQEYIAVRKELYGFSMLFDLVELLEICARPHRGDPRQDEKIERISTCAANIVAWSFDIFAYPTTTSTTSSPKTHSFNLISLLITHKKLSVQGAVNYAGSIIKDAFEEFHQLERELTVSPSDSNSSGSWAWLKSFIGIMEKETSRGEYPESASSSDKGDEEEWDQEARITLIKAYIQSLKDYIAGSINWGYETEMYFGQKGDEVRTFGWVFLNGNDPRTMKHV